jgi:hypothetical protein
MTNVPGYTVGVAFTGGESVGVGLSIPGIYALPDELLGPLQGLNNRLDAFRDAGHLLRQQERHSQRQQ